MNPLSVAGWALRGPFALFFRPSYWKPFLLIAAVSAAYLLVLVLFYSPVLLPATLPLLGFLGGEAATHYPYLYYLLPSMFEKGSLVINVLVSSIACGAATLLFARAFGFKSVAGDSIWKWAWRCAPWLIIAALLETLLQLGAARLIGLVPQKLFLQNGMVRWGTRAAMMGLSILIQGLFLYATAWIVLMGSKAFAAVRDSFRVTLRTFLPTMFVVAIPVVLLFPLNYAAGRADLIVEKFRPEMMGTLLAVHMLLQMILIFLVVGAATRLFVWRVEAAK